MPALSRSTKRKKPPRVDSDHSSIGSDIEEEERAIMPPKQARASTALTPTSGATRTPQTTSIARRMKARHDTSHSVGSGNPSAAGSRSATPPHDKINSQESSTSTPLTASQSQSTKHITPSQSKKEAESTIAVTPTTLGMAAPRRTYSQMRSYLAPIEDLDTTLDSSGLPTSKPAPRLVPTKSYNDLVLSESQEELQQDTAEKNITFNGETDLRSITEMRVKGESRRFGDDIEYVLEGLEGESVVRVRRASAVEFVGRMCEPGFVQRARASDVLGRAWSAIHQSVIDTGDRVFDAIAGIFVSLVARELQDVPGALQDNKLPSTFCTILNRARELDGLEAAASDSNWAIYADVARKAGLGKVERKQLCALLALCQKTGIVPSGQVITTRLLVSHGLALIISRPTTRPLLLTIITTASSYLHAFDTRLSGYATGLNVVPPSSAGVAHLLRLMCNLLRSCQVALDKDVPEDSDEDDGSALGGKEGVEFVRLVVTLCRVCQILMASDAGDLEEGVGALAEQTALACLKVLVLLTSSTPSQSSQSQSSQEPTPNQTSSLIVQNPLAFHVIARFVAQGGNPSVQSSQFEHACLGLALLLNLIKEGEGGAKQVKKLSVYAKCLLSRKCAVECQCKSRKSHLNLYAGLYGELEAKSTLQDDFHSTFLLGYLAVLLGLLVVNDESLKDTVYSSLPGLDGSNKFEDLAQSIEQFVHAYERVAQAAKVRVNRDEEGGNMRSGEEDEDEEEKMMAGGDGGSGIALGVAKRLRDIS